MELYWKQIMSLSEVVSIGSGKEGLISLSHPLAPWTRSSVPMILILFRVRSIISTQIKHSPNATWTWSPRQRQAAWALGTWTLSPPRYRHRCWNMIKYIGRYWKYFNVMENIFSGGKYTWKDTPPRSPRWSTCSRRCPCRGRRAETPSSGAPPTGPPWTQWTGGHVYARVWNED